MSETDEGNQSRVTEFILLGFQGPLTLKVLYFFMFLIIYLMSVMGNATILLLVIMDHHLHTPMYALLANLSSLEIGYISVSVPKMLANFFSKTQTISYAGCLMQVYFFTFLGATEFFILGLMSLDRYVAICIPLHYSSIMRSQICIRLAASAWMGGFVTTFIPVLLITRLPFCGPNLIDHFFCEAIPVLKLSCSSIHLQETVDIIFSSTVILCSFLLTIVSYILIIVTVLKIPSAKGKRKAFSTCASHLIVVIIFYSTVFSMYIKQTGNESDVNKVIAVFYAVLIPTLNPFINSLRNKEIKDALRKLLHKTKVIF
ncbi:olfactory receptor 6N1-like [Rhinatrema bivittatum]|uniref:olfactory receptor 6N1-like n=1 Tax=Rhinatrema bivittatum TaxID=194408 RepID=UPI00112D8427|nr:olfactory receptor 6N1-like [Rhinatrema bivittatum]